MSWREHPDSCRLLGSCFHGDRGVLTKAERTPSLKQAYVLGATALERGPSQIPAGWGLGGCLLGP